MLSQIAALQQLKRSQTPAESKVDSRLVVEKRLREGGLRSTPLSALSTGAKVSQQGTVEVDIRATAVTDGLLTALAQLGGTARVVSHKASSIRAALPLDAVARLAERSDVRAVEAAGGAMTARQANEPAAPVTSDTPRDKEADAASVAAEVGQAMRVRAGAVTSQGDRAHNADTARQQYGVTGAGVKICALSDGVGSLAASQARGELPARVDVLPGQAGTGNEGTAMLEILHDVAPGAELGFATAFSSDAGFADNIRKLRFDAGCDVIVDDVLYFKESPFQDWIIAQAVNEVTADGALYFSSAGNEGNTTDGTSGHWEGDFVDSGQQAGKFVGAAHDFAGAAGTQIFQPVSAASSANVPVTLHWSDPLGRSANDYDLYLFNATGGVVAFSQANQTGTQDPYERLNTPLGGGSGLRLAVVKYSGENRYLSLSALRGRFSDSPDGLKAYTTPGVTVGHSAARQAFSVAATPAATPLGRPLEPGDPANPAGPFPGSFGPGSQVERFESDGPRRMFYEADGTAITPGNVSASGGEVRQKPDLTAADGTATSVTGFNPFFGTSAAAPHAAAIAGLVLSGNPGMHPKEVREALIATAQDIEAPGVDGVSGAGVILADRVLAHTGASPQPVATAQRPMVTPNDGGGHLDPGDTARVMLPVTNSGDGAAVSTSVLLTSPTPGVTVAPRSKFYGTISPKQTGVNEFTLTVPPAHEPGVPVVLRARVTFAGAHSPTEVEFPVPVGRPSDVTQHFAYAGEPVAIPDDSEVGASVRIPVTGVGRAWKVSVSIDGTTCSTDQNSTTVGINHSFVGDLVGTLTTPGGATATLFSESGGGGNNLCQVVFADGAARAFSTVGASDAPYTGTYAPVSPLATAERVDGTWTFTAKDVAGGDIGSIRSVSLHLNGYQAAPRSPVLVQPGVGNGPVRPL
ncbi:neuroendocrine convertase 1 [Amycolatopsis suaedae]|uniref:Neuroendocrine convertase 1 n=2 Tax=Amycolatopsis suaedae TaxID=2510978 RepID=A0A4Q7JEV4_9PSEU|nr:S8 family serine peptidase [Amycolatopsis suaedae]RZQ66099.1 neuroendocrine convertase 1 [Amycolatopsis suaedae]